MKLDKAQLNKSQAKERWDDLDEKRWVQSNHKNKSAEEMAAHLGRTAQNVINFCTRQGFSYFKSPKK